MQESKEDSNEFLNELRLQFERDIDIRKTLESKTTSMITMGSTTVTVLIGIGTFLVSKIDPKNYVFDNSLWILAFGIVAAVVCITSLLLSNVLRKYTYPMGHERFFTKDEYRKEKAEEFRNAPSEKFTKRMIEEYLESIKNFSEVNSSKAKLIKIGQFSLVGAIGSIAILLCYILVNFGSNIISLKF